MQSATSDSLARWAERLPALALLGFAALALLLKYRLNHAIDVHWDEFNYLTEVYLHQQGELVRALMTFHVHLFRWVPGAAGNEVDQVLAAREAMFVLRLASSLALFLIGRRLLGATGAAFALLCSLCFSYVLKHGESFRFDPIVSCFFLLACCLLILKPGRLLAGAAAGASLALATLVSLKLFLLLVSIALISAVHFIFEAERKAVARQARRVCPLLRGGFPRSLRGAPDDARLEPDTRLAIGHLCRRLDPVPQTHLPRHHRSQTHPLNWHGQPQSQLQLPYSTPRIIHWSAIVRALLAIWSLGLRTSSIPRPERIRRKPDESRRRPACCTITAP